MKRLRGDFVTRNNKKSRNDPISEDSSRRKGKKNLNTDKVIPADIYPVIDTDLARDNLENDIPDADLQDL